MKLKAISKFDMKMSPIVDTVKGRFYILERDVCAFSENAVRIKNNYVVFTF